VIPERLPDTGPEDVAVVHIHHDPLSVEWVLVHGANVAVNVSVDDEDRGWLGTYM
jgi:hypothetical protein